MATDSKKIGRILIANRGEIAVRIIKTAKLSGIETVAIFSDADRKMPFVKMADFAVNIGPAPSADSYLNMKKIVDVALKMKCDAIHPGYGFLSENHQFARKTIENNLLFIGPDPETIRKMGDKLESKRTVKSFDVPCVPGTDSPIESTKEAKEIAHVIGLPVMIKASAGGGGKGMRIVRDIEYLDEEIKTAMSEAKTAFGDPSVFIEKYIENPRHIEVQILADRHGNVFHLNERECSIQRRHQKVIEECPSFIVDERLREKLGQAAINVAKACHYVGAGTVEFIMDQNKKFYFLEMNTRLQVEHPVTELVTGIDLVAKQIEVAEGGRLALKQADLEPRGHSIELRVYAEDPEDNFMPSIGKLTCYRPPAGIGIRVDDGYEEGLEIPVHYDPLIAKLVVFGKDRDEAIAVMLKAISDYVIHGVKTTLPFGQFVLKNKYFLSGDFNTNFVSQHYNGIFRDRKVELEKIAALISDHIHQKYEEGLIALNENSTDWRKRLIE